MSAQAPTAAPGKILLADPNLQIVFSVTVMAILGTFTVTPALPRIVRDLGISQAEIGWVITVFTLPGIFIMPLIGAMADRFGRRRVVAACLVLFGASGLACFWAWDFKTLLALRFLQGVGAAPLSSLNIAFISDLFAGRRRTTAMGYNQSVLSLGAAGFTALGGVLAGLGWRYPFMLPLLALPVAGLVWKGLKCPESARAPHLADYLASAGRTLSRRPIVLNYAVTILGLVVVWGSYFTYFPILMGLKLNQPPAVIGLVMTAMTLGSALSAAGMGRLSAVFSGRSLLRIGFMIYAAALALIPFLEKPWQLAFPVAAVGLAQGIFIPSVQNFLGRLSTPDNRGLVMAFYGSAIRVGQTLGPFSMGLAFPWVGVDGVFFVCAAATLILAVLVALTFDPD
jgi:MFS family permease